MKKILINDPRVGPWVCQQTEGTWREGRGSTIGVEQHGEVIGGIIYEDFNGASLLMHIAANGDRFWGSRKLLWFAFAYPFEQLKAKVVIGVIASHRVEAIKFVRRLGFIQTATIQDGHPKGDLLIFQLRAEHCPWHKLKVKL